MAFWAICSKVDKKERAPVIILSLEGRARDAAHELSVEELTTDTGLETLITNSMAFFLKGENQHMYMVYSNFEKYQRPPDIYEY